MGASDFYKSMYFKNKKLKPTSPNVVDKFRREAILETKTHMNSVYEKFLRSQAIWAQYLKNFQIEKRNNNILLKNQNFKGILREVLLYDFEGRNDIIIEIFLESRLVCSDIFQPFILRSNSRRDFFFIKITYVGQSYFRLMSHIYEME